MIPGAAATSRREPRRLDEQGALGRQSLPGMGEDSRWTKRPA
jgi:hypothetical protein